MQKGKGAAAGQRMIFTGPDGIGDYRPRRCVSPQQQVGAGPSSPETTGGGLSYLWRAGPHAPPPLPKRARVGEVGWCWQHSAALNAATLRSGMQIRKSVVRMEVENRASHRFLQKAEKMAVTQNPQNKV
ncbi:protein SPMIP2 isoform X2 [Phyllopteryx taeniolatus]|uniref:protein SPMIP2 isoform X2 n=1 Tax=Phyllopteryx taeniolatus TaxID=161469 RepID=UPI002AD28594|nr:protein SPMIP2 isoform X2 [Phyllopteryx taeniolatus]